MHIHDLLSSKWKIKVEGTIIFKTILKAWDIVRQWVVGAVLIDNQAKLCGEKIPMVELGRKGIPLVLLQDCSTKI